MKTIKFIISAWYVKTDDYFFRKVALVEISFRDETRPRMKILLFTREFHPRMKFNLKENLSLSMMKTYKISHFSQLLKSEAWYVKNIRRLKARCIKWLRLNAWDLQLY